MKEMRPTSGKVLLAMFNMLGPLGGRSFLDLFSGSGQISVEAHRRGAERVCAVEADKKCCAEMAKRMPAGVEFLCLDVRRALPRFVKRGEVFDIIFADPPYNLGWGSALPALLAANSAVLTPGGVIILEHSDRERIRGMDGEIWEQEERAYGGTVLSIFRRRGDTDD